MGSEAVPLRPAGALGQAWGRVRRAGMWLVCVLAILLVPSAAIANAQSDRRHPDQPAHRVTHRAKRPAKHSSTAKPTTPKATPSTAAPAPAQGAPAPIAVTNPNANCSLPDTIWSAGGSAILDAIDSCRAQEGVGPLNLPNNWDSLTAAQQLFTVINLERVNRGLTPIVGLTNSADADALIGAENDTDPTEAALRGEPDGGNVYAMSSIWAGTGSVLEADLLWMYDDGWASDGQAFNLDCTGPTAPGCWGHRDIILNDEFAHSLTGGSGAAQDSLAFSLVWTADVPSDLNFTWAAESTDFDQTPGPEAAGS